MHRIPVTSHNPYKLYRVLENLYDDFCVIREGNKTTTTVFGLFKAVMSASVFSVFNDG